jgi:hypothetical protein
MKDDPVILDARRGMQAQKATKLRREARQVEDDQEALRQRQRRAERFLCASPAASWQEVAGRARYLIELFAATPAARDPRRKRLIAATLKDLAQLASVAGGPEIPG